MADDLRISIGADNSGLRDSLRDSERAINEFVSKVERIAEVGDKLKSLGEKMTLGISLPLAGLGAAAVKAYGDIESLKKGLEAVTGSASLANEEFNKLKTVAQLPGLGMEEAVRGSIGLQAIGISADKSRKILEQFGNAVATVGKGTAEFERAIYGVQQLANTDFPLGEDLNIIKDALPQVNNLLKEAFGSSRSDELAKMGITSQQVLDTILTGLEKLPRVTGGISGAFENLQDSIKQSLARVGETINKHFDISKIVEKLTSYIDKVVSAFESLSPEMQKAIIVITGVVTAAGPLITAIGAILTMLPVFTAGIGAVSGALTAMLSPIGLVTAGIVTIVSAVVSNWDKITPYLKGTVEWFKRLYRESTVFRLGVQAVAFAFNGLGIIIKTIFTTSWQIIKSWGKNTLNLFAGVGEVIEGVFTLNWDKIKSGFSKGSQSINGIVDDTFKNLRNGFKDAFAQLNASADSWAKLDLDKLSISSPKLAEETEKSITEPIKQGLTNSVSKLKPEISKAKSEIEYEIQKPIVAKKQYLIFDAKIVPNIDTSALETRLMELTNLANIESWANEMNEAIQNLALDGLTDVFFGMGEALAQGNSIINAMGSAVLGTLGQFAVMLGREMIKIGTEAIVLGKLIAGIREWMISNPAAAIALGAAAIAVGGMLASASKSMSNIGSGGSSGSMSSGAGVSSSGSVSSYTSSGGVGNTDFRFIINGFDLVSVVDRNRERMNRLNTN